MSDSPYTFEGAIGWAEYHRGEADIFRRWGEEEKAVWHERLAEGWEHLAAGYPHST